MKKYICTLIIMICSLAFCCPAAFAGKIDLIDSAGEREEIGEAAEDIIFTVNYGGARGDIPVSYTHLDVYKRQVLFLIFPPTRNTSPTSLMERP